MTIRQDECTVRVVTARIMQPLGDWGNIQICAEYYFEGYKSWLCILRKVIRNKVTDICTAH